MTIKLYAHPLSSYCHKALIAFYENDIKFEFVMLDGSEPAASKFAALWPVKLIPDDADAAIEVRMLDRFFDNYVMTPQGKIVFDFLRAEGEHDARGIVDARAMLDTSYAVLDRWMATREWAAGGAFSLADCAAAPSLLYADWTHAIPKEFANVHAYRQRLLARPSYARVLDEQRPYRHMFPLGAPEGRD